jgi:hypothetical protein
MTKGVTNIESRNESFSSPVLLQLFDPNTPLRTLTFDIYLRLTITILDIVHHPIFNLKLNSIGLWRWYINTTITIMDIVHLPVFCLKLNSTL